MDLNLQNRLKKASLNLQNSARILSGVGCDDTVPSPEQSEARDIEDQIRRLAGRIDDLWTTIPDQQRMEEPRV